MADHLQSALAELTGRIGSEFRPGQREAIEALAIRRERVLLVQRTGWGKSAVYFLATRLLRDAGFGPTLLVSPLLALMRNQILAAQRAGIRAVTINSTNLQDWQGIHERIAGGEIDVLLVSPERLNNPGFRDEVLPRLSATAGMLVIDEAHCISDWGHDFRPDYRRIRTMLDGLPTGIAVLATTATANARVTADVAEQLGHDVLVLRGVLDRESLHLGVVRLPTAQQRLAWLADHLADFAGSGIIYCLTVAATREVADFLSSRGHVVSAYSGQTDATEREALEADLSAGRVKALVATSALGMGFDATLGFVVNLGAPSSPVAYYQQVGRAGRGTDRATVVLLPAAEDRDIWRYFASMAFPPEAQVRQTLAVLADRGGAVSTATLETYIDLSRSRLEAMLKVLDVDGAARRVRGGWEGTGQPWAYNAERYQRVAEARAVEQQAMLDYLVTDQCRMWFLRDQLDDPGAAPCGRCDNCGGLPLADAVTAAASEAALAHLARPGVPIAARKLWPTGLGNLGLELTGKIGTDVAASEGRAVARLTDLGYGQRLRESFRADAPDGPVPPDLVAAVIELLQEWRPPVTALAYVASQRRGALVTDLANGLARYLRLPLIGVFAIADEQIRPDQGATNSAQRVAAASRRYRWDGVPGVALGHDVLLVDDLVGTGWTITLAAAAIRSAGADAVRPLVLGTQT